MTPEEALHKLLRIARGESNESFMSIPARPDVDADLVLGQALRDLDALRDRVVVLESRGEQLAASLRAVLDQCEWGHDPDVRQSAKDTLRAAALAPEAPGEKEAEG